uniref:THD domain-containing protein n=1 Tax=Anabas testudineus TaxID=64144 RepID=A0AAQ6INN7_ANATE
MAEGGAGTSTQVFVVDSQATYVSVPSEKKKRWARVSQKLLLLLVGLALLGLVVEGYFILSLYKKTEGGLTMTRVGYKESNEIPIVQQHQEQTPQRPFAHLMGSDRPVDENNVVQWVNEGGEAITHNMSYDKGRLIVEKEGYYYLYSKVQLNAADDCQLIQHKVMKNTSAYGQAIELMKSKSFRCKTQKPSGPRASGGEDLWNSFLAGIFHLQSGDKIFVSLENIRVRPGLAYNFMGAFMIFP